MHEKSHHRVCKDVYVYGSVLPEPKAPAILFVFSSSRLDGHDRGDSGRGGGVDAGFILIAP